MRRSEKLLIGVIVGLLLLCSFVPPYLDRHRAQALTAATAAEDKMLSYEFGPTRLTSTLGEVIIGDTYIQRGTWGSGFANWINLEVCTTNGALCPAGVCTCGLTDFGYYVRMHSDGGWFQVIDDTDWDTIDVNRLMVTNTGPHEIDSNGCARAFIRAFGDAFYFTANAETTDCDDTYVKVLFTMEEH